MLMTVCLLDSALDAWDAVFGVTITLRSNGNFPEWYEEPGVAVACCTDGSRPHIFKLERT